MIQIKVICKYSSFYLATTIRLNQYCTWCKSPLNNPPWVMISAVLILLFLMYEDNTKLAWKFKFNIPIQIHIDSGTNAIETRISAEAFVTSEFKECWIIGIMWNLENNGHEVKIMLHLHLHLPSGNPVVSPVWSYLDAPAFYARLDKF